jgi:hypothetical protein
MPTGLRGATEPANSSNVLSGALAPTSHVTHAQTPAEIAQAKAIAAELSVVHAVEKKEFESKSNPFFVPDTNKTVDRFRGFSKKTWAKIFKKVKTCEFDEDCPKSGICVDKQCLVLDHHTRNAKLNSSTTPHRFKSIVACTYDDECPHSGICVDQQCMGIHHSIRPGYIKFEEPKFDKAQPLHSRAVVPQNDWLLILLLIATVVAWYFHHQQTQKDAQKYVRITRGDDDDDDDDDENDSTTQVNSACVQPAPNWHLIKFLTDRDGFKL